MVLKVNSERLWQSLMDMAQIGATSKGGCNRGALTDLDIEARELFAKWCQQESLTVSYDAVGNMFARFDGADASLAPLVIGSHLDTQPTGGKFDGILGVLAGLEVVRTLKEAGFRPERSIEIADWMNEEGARFAPAMMGSGVYSGMLDLEEVRAIRDSDGVLVGAELDRHGYSDCPHPSSKEIYAYLELHIEQGPALEAEEKSIGVVTGAQGIRWYDLTLTGQEAHAGPTPMSHRKDPVSLLPALIDGILELGKRDPAARATVGHLNASPGSRNVVPGQIDLSVDLRHPDEAVLSSMNQRLQQLVSDLKTLDGRIEVELHQIWHSPVVEFDKGLISTIHKGIKAYQLDHMDIISGAGHDALMLARKVPTAMIFTPCRDGISHNEAEHIELGQAADGANALLAAVQCNAHNIK